MNDNNNCKNYYGNYYHNIEREIPFGCDSSKINQNCFKSCMRENNANSVVLCNTFCKDYIKNNKK